MIKYSASYSRMRGLKGKLPEKDLLEGFLSAPDTQVIVSVLNRTAYGDQILDSADIRQVEHNLKQDLILSYIKILAFMTGKSAYFVKTLLGRFELLNLKSIIRSLVQKSAEANSAEVFIFSLGKYHTIPVEKALKAGDLESCIALMERTPFARPLEIGYQQYKAEGNLFPLELALDLDYYERLWRAMDNLGPLDKRNAARILGVQYDITNLLWILRYKEYYKFTPERIFQYTIPHGWNIRWDTLLKIASEGDLVGTITALRLKPYDDLLRSVTQVNGSFIMGVELSLLRYLYRECLSMFMKFPLQMAPILAFSILKEMQIRDIVTVLSGINRGLSQERIRAYMITLQR